MALDLEGLPEPEQLHRAAQEVASLTDVIPILCARVTRMALDYQALYARCQAFERKLAAVRAKRHPEDVEDE